MVEEIGKFALQQGVASGIESLRGSLTGKDAAERKKAAQEFSSFLFLEVLKAMRATVSQGGFLETESVSRDVYTAMMDAEIARAMARRDGSGLTQMVERLLENLADRSQRQNGSPTPTQGVISSGFGPRTDPFSGARRFHKGIDIAAPAGSSVKAVAAGKVIYSGWNDGYGNLIEIDHGNGVVSRYGHNAVNLVSVGDEVRRGQDIAQVGSTGRSSDSHLHFEIRKHGKPINPKIMLGELTYGFAP